MKTNTSTLIQNFINNMDGLDASENTLINYESDINKLVEYLDTLDIDVTEANLQDLEGYRTHLKQTTYGNGRKYSSSTRARYMTSIRMFYEYLYDRDIIKNNPASKLVLPKIAKGNKIDFISKKQGQKILDSTAGQLHETRDRLVLRVFMETGLRLSELSKLNISDIDGTTIHIMSGKGNKYREVFTTESLKRDLEAYLDTREDQNESLFISQKGNRMATSTIKQLVKKYIKKAGLDTDKYSTHSLRHGFASVMLQNGVDIVSIQQLLGHSSLQTTQIYAQVNDKTKQKAANTMENVYN